MVVIRGKNACNELPPGAPRRNDSTCYFAVSISADQSASANAKVLHHVTSEHVQIESRRRSSCSFVGFACPWEAFLLHGVPDTVGWLPPLFSTRVEKSACL